MAQSTAGLHPPPGAIQSSAMREVAYLFERFPSFGQTFCYREVAELERQGMKVQRLSNPAPGERAAAGLGRKHCGPRPLSPGGKSAGAGGRPRSCAAKRYRRKPRSPQSRNGAGNPISCGFTRRFTSASGCNKTVSGMSTRISPGMAARTAYWMRAILRDPLQLYRARQRHLRAARFRGSLTKLFEGAAAVVTVSDYSVRDLKTRFPQSAAKFHRVYNGVDLGPLSSARISAAASRRLFRSAG